MVIRISDKTQNYSKVTKLLVKPNIIQNEIKRLNSVKLQYLKIYTDLYNHLEKLYKSSVDRQAIKAISNASNGLGKIVNKVPLLEK